MFLLMILENIDLFNLEVKFCDTFIVGYYKYLVVLRQQLYKNIIIFEGLCQNTS